MIARHWRGVARSEEEANYVTHLKTETFPKLAKIDGFVRACILRRPVPSGTEFLILTIWESMDAIRTFAGENVDVAVVPDVAQAMMVAYDKTVAHYEVVETYPSNRAM